MERQREIKFRAWDKEKKLMFFVSDLHAPDRNNHFMVKEGCELMQFTGLRDKNGVEVFEGDTFASGTIALKNWHVQWIDHWGKFCLVSHRRMTGKMIFNSIQRVPKMEIVGNIYKKD